MLMIIIIPTVKANIFDGILKIFTEGEDKKPELIKMDWSKDLYANPDGSKSLILYSRLRNTLDSDGKWKRIENATSLKAAMDAGKIKVSYSKKEDGLDFEVIDLNYTSITLKPLNTKENTLLKVDGLERAIISKGNTFSFKFSFENNVFMHEFTAGKNSTTIMLSVADSENIDDTYVDEDAPTSNYGTGTYLYTFGGAVDIERESYLKFNISSLPTDPDIIINDAQIYYYIQQNALDTDAEGWIEVPYKIYQNYSWVEEEMTFNNKPNSSYINKNNQSYISMFGGTGEPVGWVNMNITGYIQESYSNSDTNITILITVPEARFGVVGSTDHIYIASKETSGTSADPYMNITYSDEEVPTTSTTTTTTTTEETTTTTTTTTTEETTTTTTTTTIPPCESMGTKYMFNTCTKKCSDTTRSFTFDDFIVKLTMIGDIIQIKLLNCTT
jgi:hypothetical protein